MRNEVIKCRIGDGEKERLSLAAEMVGISLSEFVRFAAHRAADEAISPRQYRIDLDTIRRSTNVLESAIPFEGFLPTDQAKVLEAMAALQEIAARGLGLTR